jgi:hypothetical protein
VLYTVLTLGPELWQLVAQEVSAAAGQPLTAAGAPEVVLKAELSGASPPAASEHAARKCNLMQRP